MIFVSNHYNFGNNSNNGRCCINEEALKNSKLRKSIQHYNSLSEYEKKRVDQISRLSILASLTQKKFVKGIITNIKVDVNDSKKTYTFNVSNYKQDFKYFIYEDDEKENLNVNDNILAVVNRENDYYLVKELEHQI